MRVMRLTTIGVVALASAAVAVGQGGSSSGRQANTKDPEQIVCRRIADSSSLVGGRRECRTRANWERIAQEARTNNPISSAMSGSASGNN